MRGTVVRAMVSWDRGRVGWKAGVSPGPIARAMLEPPARPTRAAISGRDLFVGKLREIGTLACMLDCDPIDAAIRTKIKEGVLIKILGVYNPADPELDVQGICVLKVLDLHGTNLRSKKAL